MDVKVIVVTHKNYRMPLDSCYVPVYVGNKETRSGKSKKYQTDDTGVNIADKNPNYCELTALYWAWKNLDYDYLGLAHYRRHFTVKSKFYQKKHGKFASILTDTQLKMLLKENDILLPKKRYYLLDTIYQHYVHTHYPEPLEETAKIIKKEYPKMYNSYQKVMKRRSAHMFNMFIMKREYAQEYCSFLFEVLEKLERRIDISAYDSFQARVYGRISELLLDVWLVDKKYSYKDIGFLYMEPVNWYQKIKKFLASKFLHRYY